MARRRSIKRRVSNARQIPWLYLFRTIFERTLHDMPASVVLAGDSQIAGPGLASQVRSWSIYRSDPSSNDLSQTCARGGEIYSMHVLHDLMNDIDSQKEVLRLRLQLWYGRMLEE